jgi:hypothetical protein
MSEPLRLVNIQSAGAAWQRLAALKLPSHTAYGLLKYLRKVEAEAGIIETQRVKLIREAAGKPEGDVSLNPGTPEHATFSTEFGKMLATECDLAPFDMTLDGLMDLAGKEQGNLLSASDLAQLEPFFKVNGES